MRSTLTPVFVGITCQLLTVPAVRGGRSLAKRAPELTRPPDSECRLASRSVSARCQYEIFTPPPQIRHDSGVLRLSRCTASARWPTWLFVICFFGRRSQFGAVAANEASAGYYSAAGRRPLSMSEALNCS